ncbi:MAG: redoxin domain-containing protein [Chloroflexota bacterium]
MRIVYLLAFTLLLAACGGAPASPASSTTASDTTDPTSAPSTAEPTLAPSTDEPTPVVPTDEPTLVPPTAEPTLAPPADAITSSTVDLPSWASLPLIDVNTGEQFALEDFAGQTVYVHLMATWCQNCLASQRRLRDQVIPVVTDQVDVVFVSVDVQTQITDDTLAGYTERHGFDWQFSVASQAFMNEMTAAFGRNAANPPSQPHFVIFPNGTVTSLLTGGSSAQEEIDLITGQHGVGG